VLREEFAKNRPAEVPDAPTHESLTVAAAAAAAAAVEMAAEKAADKAADDPELVEVAS
jgi:H2-forming N5,N10-methylenetetrahydromethanopterin dehydrogenase-like enzyme